MEGLGLNFVVAPSPSMHKVDLLLDWTADTTKGSSGGLFQDDGSFYDDSDASAEDEEDSGNDEEEEDESSEGSAEEQGMFNMMGKQYLSVNVTMNSNLPSQMMGFSDSFVTDGESSEDEDDQLNAKGFALEGSNHQHYQHHPQHSNNHVSNHSNTMMQPGSSHSSCHGSANGRNNSIHADVLSFDVMLGKKALELDASNTLNNSETHHHLHHHKSMSRSNSRRSTASGNGVTGDSTYADVLSFDVMLGKKPPQSDTGNNLSKSDACHFQQKPIISRSSSRRSSASGNGVTGDSMYADVLSFDVMLGKKPPQNDTGNNLSNSEAHHPHQRPMSRSSSRRGCRSRSQSRSRSRSNSVSQRQRTPSKSRSGDSNLTNCAPEPVPPPTLMPMPAEDDLEEVEDLFALLVAAPEPKIMLRQQQQQAKESVIPIESSRRASATGSGKVFPLNVSRTGRISSQSSDQGDLSRSSSRRSSATGVHTATNISNNGMAPLILDFSRMGRVSSQSSDQGDLSRSSSRRSSATGVHTATNINNNGMAPLILDNRRRSSATGGHVNNVGMGPSVLDSRRRLSATEGLITTPTTANNNNNISTINNNNNINAIAPSPLDISCASRGADLGGSRRHSRKSMDTSDAFNSATTRRGMSISNKDLDASASAYHHSRSQPTRSDSKGRRTAISQRRASMSDRRGRKSAEQQEAMAAAAIAAVAMEEEEQQQLGADNSRSNSDTPTNRRSVRNHRLHRDSSVGRRPSEIAALMSQSETISGTSVRRDPVLARTSTPTSTGSSRRLRSNSSRRLLLEQQQKTSGSTLTTASTDNSGSSSEWQQQLEPATSALASSRRDRSSRQVTTREKIRRYVSERNMESSGGSQEDPGGAAAAEEEIANTRLGTKESVMSRRKSGMKGGTKRQMTRSKSVPTEAFHDIMFVDIDNDTIAAMGHDLDNELDHESPGGVMSALTAAARARKNQHAHASAKAAKTELLKSKSSSGSARHLMKVKTGL
jgi:hypothetical protein